MNVPDRPLFCVTTNDVSSGKPVLQSHSQAVRLMYNSVSSHLRSKPHESQPSRMDFSLGMSDHHLFLLLLLQIATELPSWKDAVPISSVFKRGKPLRESERQHQTRNPKRALPEVGREVYRIRVADSKRDQGGKFIDFAPGEVGERERADSELLQTRTSLDQEKTVRCSVSVLVAVVVVTAPAVEFAKAVSKTSISQHIVQPSVIVLLLHVHETRVPDDETPQLVHFVGLAESRELEGVIPDLDAPDLLQRGEVDRLQVGVVAAAAVDDQLCECGAARLQRLQGADVGVDVVSGDGVVALEGAGVCG